jgi:hypothetical protein
MTTALTDENYAVVVSSLAPRSGLLTFVETNTTFRLRFTDFASGNDNPIEAAFMVIR